MDRPLIDPLWVILSAALVLLLQGGFFCFETGLTRHKNYTHLTVKNLSDFGIAVLLFWMWGYGLMFGPTEGGWIGTSQFMPVLEKGTARAAAFLIFQIMLCATAVTIFSGAVAGRMRLAGYLGAAAVVSGVVYPLFGHWAWNGNLNGPPAGWLGQRGFVDFAGSSVVHSVAGAVALAALLLIGRRPERFWQDRRWSRSLGSDTPLAMLGLCLLWLGWFGLNGGSTFAMDTTVPAVLLNTILAGAAGMLAVLVWEVGFHGRVEAAFLMKGSLAGLVAITGACHAVDAESALVIGALGGFTMLGVCQLLARLRIDDAVGVVPVHLGAGVWGTAAVALFGSREALETGLSLAGQLQIQLLGVLTCILWAFGTTYIALWALNRFCPLRVDAEEAFEGLPLTENRAAMEPLEPTAAVTPRLRDPESHAEASRKEIASKVHGLTEAFQRKNEELKLLRSVARAANGATSVEQAFQTVLDEVCAFTKWPMGHVYARANDGSGEFVSRNIWHLDDAQQCDAFRAAIEGTRLRPERGLVGRVAKTAKPEWSSDVSEDRHPLWASTAAELGVKAGFAFPVLVGGEVKAVMEFFSREKTEPDAHLLDLLAGTGDPLAWVIGREEANQALRIAKAETEAARRELDSANLRLNQVMVRSEHMAGAARQGTEAKSQFLTNMSHELRTPLTAILGFSELLLSDAEAAGQKELAEDLARIHDSAGQLLELINGILDLSKIEARKMDLNLETFDVDKMLGELTDTVRPLVEKRDNTLAIHASGSLGLMHSDPVKVRQCVSNLLSNANKFTEKGKIQIAVARQTHEYGDHVIFRVEDTGIGMTQEQIGKLFQPFSQAETTTSRRYGGSGLGLAITRNFSEMLGGSITVSSVLGQGSTFVLDLPAEPPGLGSNRAQETLEPSVEKQG